MMLPEKIVIIGNGIAGLSAAESARKKNNRVSITIISEEKYLTYNRIRLCELLANNFEENELYMRPSSWYEENEITLMLDKTITKIVPDERYIVLNNTEKISFTKLIIASGAHSYLPHISGIEKDGVYTIRTLQDINDINEYFKKVRHAVVVGGGLLGLECAYHMNMRGIQTTIIEFKPRLLPNQLDKHGSQIFENKVKSLGINVQCDTTVEEILGDEFSKEIKFKSGETLATDCTIFATGVRSNIDIVKGTNIALNKAIVVNNRMETNIQNIYAVGDIAELDGKWYGLWTIALAQGKIAGTNAAIGNINSENFMEYVPRVPPYFLNSMGTKVSSLGDIGRDQSAVYEVEYYIEESNYIYQKLFFKNDTLVGSILIGDTRKSNKINMAIKSKMSKADALEAGLINK